jgi:hypothetical protein
MKQIILIFLLFDSLLLGQIQPNLSKEFTYNEFLDM